MSSRSRKLLQWLLGSIAALVVLIGLLVAAFGLIVGRVPEYRVQLQSWINERSGLVVEFGTLSARLRLYGPELVFDDAVVRTPDRTRVLATATRGSVGFDIWRAIGTGRLSAGRFSLESPEIGLIRTREGRIQLAGQSALPERDDAKPFAIERLPTGRFEVVDAVLSFRDEITGRGPWSLSGVSFDLTRDSESLRLRGNASLPSSLGDSLDFSATAEGAFDQPGTVVSTFGVQGERLDLAGWADVLPDEWPAPETGHGSMRVNGTFRGARLVQLSADADFSDIAAALPAWSIPLPVALPLQRRDNVAAPESEQSPDGAATSAAGDAEAPGSPPPPVLPDMSSYERIAFALRAQRLGDEWSASLRDVDIAHKGVPWRAKEISARWSQNSNDGDLKASGAADRIVLQNLWPLLAYLPESEDLARLRALAASGVVENVSVSYERAATAAAPTYSVQASVDDFAFEPSGKTPGLAGLSGELRATQQGGHWQLAASDAQFELPRMFRQPFVVQSLDGTIEWQRTDAGWTIRSDEVRVHSEDGRAVARFEAAIPGDGSSPVLDLSAQGQDLQASATSKYIPAGRLGTKTIAWFDRAFVDGRVISADLAYKGPTRAFPFRNKEGTFLARAHVEDAVFDYQAGWTPAAGIVADVEFRNEGLQVQASSANIGNLRVSKATAGIADIKQNTLVIKGDARGDLQHALQFLKDSPLGPKLGTQFARLNGQGAMNADVNLRLPIRRMADRRIEVTVKLADATVAMQNLDAPVTDLTGALTVRNTLIASADLHGQWLGGPLEVIVRLQGDSASVLNARIRADAAQLQPLLKAPSVKLSGTADWRVATTLLSNAGDSSQGRTVQIDSDLRGFEIELPQPLGKRAEDARALRLNLEFDGGNDLLARGSLGDVRTLIRLHPSANGWSLDRGTVQVDGDTPALPDHPGLRIEGSIDRFVLDEWLALRGSAGGGKPLSEYLRAVNVRIGEFELYGYRWPDVRGILQATAAGWRVDVDGPNAAGQILIPENFTGAQPLRATLERLSLDKAEKSESGTTRARDPRSLPSLQVYVADLRAGARAIGMVDLKASRVPQGIRFDSVTVVGESAQGEGRGEWLETADGPRSSLEATITSTDVAATLKALDYTGFIEAQRGEIHADLSWPGGFNGNILARASGAISVDAQSGQLVNLEPGAGRVLGLFSVAALPRRLALDFSDLTGKGLAFDSVHGDFELREGDAHTTNLLLRGPAAEIGIAGRTGLGTRDYDQTAVVTGNLGASLPVAGALAGGPAVGAALLLFSQVFKEPLKGITRGYYRITGPWDNPAVERVDASEVKETAAKTEAVSD